jgi:5-oxoprolinase (ATP-hydrolysing)
MTNTRITDPEILERRYPVLLRTFGLRSGSGGKGLHPGGEGVIREIEFLRPMEVGILSERRAFRPYGLEGGHPAAPGENYIVTRVQVGGDDVEQARERIKEEEEEEEKKGGGKKGGSAKKGRGKKAATAAAAPAAASSSSSSSSSSSYTTRLISLGGKNTYKAQPHDRIRILTPGGGGWGTPPEEVEAAVGGQVTLKRKHEAEAGEAFASKKAHTLPVATSTVTVQQSTSADVTTTTTYASETVHLRTGGSVAAWQSMQEQA